MLHCIYSHCKFGVEKFLSLEVIFLGPYTCIYLFFYELHSLAIKSMKPVGTFYGVSCSLLRDLPTKHPQIWIKTQNQGNEWHLQDESLLSLWTEVLNLVALPLLQSIHPMFIMNLDLHRLL
jgi:hypothetical protein